MRDRKENLRNIKHEMRCMQNYAEYQHEHNLYAYMIGNISSVSRVSVGLLNRIDRGTPV